jgi:hypothetical protein
MYGLKEAGKLSNLRLVSLLSSFGFHETFTPCLFKHVSRPILLVLAVDDFGVKYRNRSDFDFLVSCLSTLYHAKAYPIASKFLGFAFSHNRTARTFTVSYPGYASHLLARLRLLCVPPCNSPSIYTPPVFGSRAPQSPTGPDLSPSASPAQAKELQVAVDGNQDPPRHLRPRIRAGLPRPLHHGPPPTFARIRGGTSRRSENFPSVGYAATRPIRRLLPLPLQRRQRRRWPELSRAHRRR